MTNHLIILPIILLLSCSGHDNTSMMASLSWGNYDEEATYTDRDESDGVYFSYGDERCYTHSYREYSECVGHEVEEDLEYEHLDEEGFGEYDEETYTHEQI